MPSVLDDGFTVLSWLLSLRASSRCCSRCCFLVGMRRRKSGEGSMLGHRELHVGLKCWLCSVRLAACNFSSLQCVG